MQPLPEQDDGDGDDVPAIQVTGRLTGCTPGTDNYGESTTVEQDGHILSESGDHAGSGLVSCSNPRDPRSEPTRSMPAAAPPVHPGRVRITMTVQSYSTSVKFSVTRWATVPG
ncbi:MAG TPA: hypothetical protein VGB75_08275 [Jatrophihabitans sp.]|uniref:hypothetical protein n=1 Tax=Jatrophihabitans sp. TaxID=1932789 RepID=UPI002F1A9EF3